MDISDVCAVRPIDHECAVGCISATSFFPHLAVLAVEGSVLDSVTHRHVAYDLTETDRFVVVDSIAGDGLTVRVLHDRAVQEHRELIIGVIPSSGRTDSGLFLIDDGGRADDVGYLGVRSVPQRVAGEGELRISEQHLHTEDC